MQTQPVSPSRVNWKEVFIFFAVAVLVSAPFRLRLVNLKELLPLPDGLSLIYYVFRGIGPAIGYLVMFNVLKSKTDRPFTFWGVNKMYSLIAVLCIPISLTVAGVNNDLALDTHYFGFVTGMVLIFYAMGEEYGWRGYLQQALAPLPVLYRILTIAVFWYVWHLNYFIPEITLRSHIIHFLFLVLGSWGLLRISESTRSMIFVVAVHLSFNILSDVNMDSSRKLIVVGAAAAVWTILMISLVRKQKKVSSK
jgi:membrane protease YdiL (CAAX protease family)